MGKGKTLRIGFGEDVVEGDFRHEGEVSNVILSLYFSLCERLVGNPLRSYS